MFQPDINPATSEVPILSDTDQIKLSDRRAHIAPEAVHEHEHQVLTQEMILCN